MGRKIILEADVKASFEQEQVLSTSDLIQNAISKRSQTCKCIKRLNNQEDTCMVLKLTHPSSINLTDNESLNGVNIADIPMQL